MSRILIGGTGRCGTNLLKNILMTNDSFYGLSFESRLFIDPDGLCSFYRNLEQFESPFVLSCMFDRFKRLYLQLGSKDTSFYLDPDQDTLPYCDWELSKHICKYYQLFEIFEKNFVSSSFSANYPRRESSDSIIYTFYPNYKLLESLSILANSLTENIHHKNESIFVDDNTFNHLFFDTYNKFFNNALFIHLVRDPRDVIASFISQRWAPQTLEKAVKFYINIMESWNSTYSNLSPENILTLKFEDLIHSPHEVLDTISNKISRQFKFNISLIDIDKSNISSWKHKIPPKFHSFLNKELGPYIYKYNYLD